MVSNSTIRVAIIAVVVIASCACSGNNDNAHTTATTFVSPPPQQVLRAESRPAVTDGHRSAPVPNNQPSLFFDLPNGKTFREGEEVVISFSLVNARLKQGGGDFRVRYIVDDDDMKWIDRQEQIALSGWVPGKHTIRLELVGPDGWPYGDNIITREITVTK